MKPPVRTQRLMRLAGAVLVSALIVAACLVGSAAAGPRRTIATAASGCGVSVVDDPYDGFQVGVPAGWNLFTLGNLIVVQKYDSDIVEGVVYPALLTSGLTPQRFFGVAIGELRRDLSAEGDSLGYHVTSSAGGLTEASLSGRVEGVAVSGEARVSVSSDRTAHGSRLVVMSAYWAPPAALGADRTALAAIGGCYAPRPAELFRVVQDQAFTYSIPPGWAVSLEAQDELDITLGSSASATFVLTLTNDSAVDSAPTLLKWFFGRLGVAITHTLIAVTAPAATSVTGATDESEYVEFTGTNKSHPIHGVVFVESSTSDGITSGTIRLAVAKPSLWDSLNGGLLRIVGGIQYQFKQDIQQWENLNEEWQRFGQQVDGFDDALNGEDLVEDTSTGAVFEAPYNAYLANGPDGPGYYTGSPGDLQPLRIVTP